MGTLWSFMSTLHHSIGKCMLICMAISPCLSGIEVVVVFELRLTLANT